MSLPLDGVRVVELAEQAFVPSAGAALADFGADVIKIERPTGDALRRNIANGMLPSAGGVDYMFELINRNKRGIALDITTPAGREVFERLVATADVFLSNQLPQVQRKLATTPEDLFKVNPKLVFARGHGQGQRGPDAEAGGYDSVSYWQRGGVSQVLTSASATEPTQQRPGLGDLPSGMYLAAGVCAALVRAARTGTGTVVDTALLNSATWTLGPDLAYASVTDRQMQLSTTPRSPLTYSYRTADGRFVGLMMINESRYWKACTHALGLHCLGETYADETVRAEHYAELRQPFADVIASLTAAEITERLGGAGCIFSFYASPSDVIADPAVAANGYLMAHPDRPELKLSAAPVQFDDHWPSLRRGGPRLGEHSEQLLGELGYDADEISALLAAQAVVADNSKPS